MLCFPGIEQTLWCLPVLKRSRTGTFRLKAGFVFTFPLFDSLLPFPPDPSSSFFPSLLPINFGYPFLLCNVYFYFLQNYLKLNVYDYPHLDFIVLCVFWLFACELNALGTPCFVGVKERETGRPFQNGYIYSWCALRIPEPWPLPLPTPNYHFGINTKLLVCPLGHEKGDTHRYTRHYTPIHIIREAQN